MRVTISQITAPSGEKTAISPTQARQIARQLAGSAQPVWAWRNGRTGESVGVAEGFSFDGQRLSAEVTSRITGPAMLVVASPGLPEIRLSDVVGVAIAEAEKAAPVTIPMPEGYSAAAVEFCRLVNSFAARGARNPVLAAMSHNPKLYAHYREALCRPGKSPASGVQEFKRRLLGVPPEKRAVAIARMARENPEIYNAARAAGQV